MKKRLISKFASVCMMLCVLFVTMVLPASAESTDYSINVKLSPEAEGTELTLYTVGTYNDKSEVALNDAFVSCEVNLNNVDNAANAQTAAQKLADFAAEKGIEGKVGFVSGDGILTFKDLDVQDSLYLIVKTGGSEEVEVSPMITALPYYDDNGIYQKSVSFDAKFRIIKVEPKGSVILNKVDENNKLIEGAKFRFEKEEIGELSSETEWKVLSKELVTNKYGQIVVKDLPYGKYRFVETQAPKGYLLEKEPCIFTIANEGTVKLDRGVYVVESGKPEIIYFKNKKETVVISTPESSIVSQPSSPDTPVITGDDAGKFIVIGSIVGVSLILVVVLVIVSNKKKK